jgi:hypothetical protein
MTSTDTVGIRYPGERKAKSPATGPAAASHHGAEAAIDPEQVRAPAPLAPFAPFPRYRAEAAAVKRTYQRDPRPR